MQSIKYKVYGQLIIWLLFLALSFTWSDIIHLGALCALCFGYYCLSRAPIRDLVREMRFLLPILASVLAIYALVYQSYEGIISGLGIGLRVFMIFIPLEVLLKTSTIGEILFSFRKLMPYRYLFMLTIAVRFVPYFSKELEEIIAIQRMRGVELCLKTFISREGINALLIPLTIRGIRAADEITISAVSRGFGIHNRRSSIHE